MCCFVVLIYCVVLYLNDDNGSCYDLFCCYNGCWELLMFKSGVVEFDIILVGGFIGFFIGDGCCGFVVLSVVV